MTIEDIAAYKAVESDPICIEYRDKYKICTADSPSTGITVLQALKLLERFDLKELYSKNLSQFMNVCFEALKLAFADRNAFFADNNKAQYYKPSQFLDQTYINSRSRLIKVDYSKDTYQSGFNGGTNKDYGKSNSTTHVSVVDEFGNAVSFTNSIENALGSMLIVDGFLLNNTMTDFNFDPIFNEKPAANRPEGSKKPRSSMSPILVFNLDDGSLKAVLGSPGGARIISYALKNLVLLLDIELEPQAISKLPNFVTMNSGNVEIEKRTKQSMSTIVDDLTKFGQNVSFENDLTSGVNIIASYKNCTDNKKQIIKTQNLVNESCPILYKGYADFRRAGLALGY